jgi:signal transduction histidine kinase/ActR/RegA family two-component response regulator
MTPASGSSSDGVRRADELTEGWRQEAPPTAEALQDAIIQSASFSSIATDAKGVIQLFNAGAERMLGYQAAEVTNRVTPAQISDPQEGIARAAAMSLEFSTTIAPGFESLAFKASRGIEDIYELTYIRKDGTRLPAVVSVTALRDQPGAIIGYLLIGTDNTARKKVESEHHRHDQLLRDQRAELSAKAVAEKDLLVKSDLFSNMSHELLSPLNGVLGFAQLMASETPPPTPRQQESIAQILRAGWHLLALFEEILDLAKVESGMVSLSPEPVSLAEVVVECQALVEEQALQRGIQVAFSKPDAHLFVRADRVRLKQVLVNLLSNAVKYSRRLGTVEVRCAASAPGRIRVSIRDTGAGLPPERLAQLFQPFNRLGQESSGVEGAGIGLVVSKHLVELMKGAIGVESAVGVGSTFWFELVALAEPKPVPDGGEPERAEPSTVPGGRPVRRLLYVEDNLANLKLVERLIQRRPDLALISAGTGQRGIQLARSRLPDVILLDFGLPDLSGLEVLARLQSDPATAHIPVIAISGSATANDIRAGLQAGLSGYLTKPIKLNEFTTTLDAALEQAKLLSPKISTPEERT